MKALPRNRVLVGDALVRLRHLPTASVDCVITSPPYWATRNYQVSGQLGTEPSIQGWVAHLVAVCDELARVLKPEGSLWLNVGDTYSRRDAHGAAPKSLLLGPERLLLALSARGWSVRNRVVWSKPNPMPSPVQDRLANTWEPLYLLVRSRRYYFNLNAIREPHRTTRRRQLKEPAVIPTKWRGPLAGDQSGLARLKLRGLAGHPLGKNPGDVWTLSTSNFRGGHYATFPEALVERPLIASCPELTCTNCGQAWQPREPAAAGQPENRPQLRPACDCQAAARPGVVLDPFMGSGTTALVAERHGRDWLGIDLNPAFGAMTERRAREARTDHAA